MTTVLDLIQEQVLLALFVDKSEFDDKVALFDSDEECVRRRRTTATGGTVLYMEVWPEYNRSNPTIAFDVTIKYDDGTYDFPFLRTPIEKYMNWVHDQVVA